MEIMLGICGGGEMKRKWLFFLRLGIIGAIALFATPFVRGEEQLFSDITVKMYVLKPGSGASTGELCRVDDPSTPGNEGDTRYGCTADPRRPYPYPTNPATVSIEEDYLLDVVPREMGTDYHPLA